MVLTSYIKASLLHAGEGICDSQEAPWFNTLAAKSAG